MTKSIHVSASSDWAFDPADLTRAPLPREGRRFDAVRRVLPSDSVGLRAAVLLIVVVAAYHYSLLTLVRNLGLDTPLAYLGLVPPMAIGMAFLLPRPDIRREIHDRQTDLIVGLPLIAAALVVDLVLPDKLNSEFWVYRYDLLTIPFFVAGAVVLLFGVQTAWRFRAPILFLFLAWPVPYAYLIEHYLDATTSSTIHGINAVIHHWHVATQVAGGDGSTFTIVHAHQPYQVSVASSCSGVNGIVGFALVGTAFGALVSGGRLRKAVWLTLGLALVWVFNVARIVVIFAAGRAWGQRVADDGLHPFLGLVVFGAAVLLMVAAMPLFRLRIGANATSADVLPPLRSRLQARPRAAVGMRLAGVSLAIGAVALTAVDGGLSRFELTAGDFGAPKVVGFDTTQSTVAGYASAEIASYPWVKNFFGSAASWQRYEYSPTYGTYGASFGGYGSGSQVIVDVIDSKHIGPFNAYGIEACYAFHGYSVTGEHTVDLGGVQGHVLQYKDSGRSWNVVYWIWVVDEGHGQKRYERVVLLQSAGTADSLDSAAATPDQNPLKGVGYVAPGTVATPLTPGQTERALHEGEDQLVAFARETVAGASPVTSTGT